MSQRLKDLEKALEEIDCAVICIADAEGLFWGQSEKRSGEEHQISYGLDQLKDRILRDIGREYIRSLDVEVNPTYD